MITTIAEAFSYPFFQRAFFVGCILSVVCALLGNYVVLRKETLITHTISHIALLGISLGLLFHIDINFMMLISTIIGAFVILYFQSSQRFASDSILAFIAQISIAFAIICMSLLEGYRTDVMQYLFGDMLALSNMDIYTSLIIGSGIIVSIIFLQKPLLRTIFNREIAISSGQNIFITELTFLVLLALTVALGIKIVGVLLIAALLVIPSNIAKLIAHNFKQLQVYAIVFALFGCIIGLFSAYIFDIPSGATIIATLGVFLFAINITRV